MNIFIVSAMFPPVRTGTSNYSKNLAISLQKRGHNINVITLKNNEAKSDSYPFQVFRLPCIHINLKNYFKHFRIASFYPRNYYSIEKLIKKYNPDFILLINHYLDIVFPAIYAAKKNNIPLFISVGTQLQSLNSFKNWILRIADRSICGNFVFPYCKNIISWDKEIERYINDVHKNKFYKKTVIIPFGVNGNNDIFESFFNSYSLNNQIIGVGAIIDQRNFVFQIQVFKELINFLPNLKLKIIGHIYKKEAILLTKVYGLENKIIFTGEQPHEVVIKEMMNSDFHWMMLDGEYKGLGTSNLEAMLLGVPVISNVPENLFDNNSLKDMFNYIYTDGRKIDLIVKKIISLYNSKELRAKIGVNGKEFVKQKMNWDIVAKKMEELLRV